MTLQKYPVPYLGKRTNLQAPVGSRLSYPVVRMLLQGVVPEGFREIETWFDPSDDAKCFLIGSDYAASVVRAYEFGDDDMWFDEQIVSYPIRLWLRK